MGLQALLRRAEVTRPCVGDPHQNRGFESLRVVRKGPRKDALAMHSQTAQRIRDYLAAVGHAGDFADPLFRPRPHNGRSRASWGYMAPDAIDSIPRKYAARIALTRGCSAHSMRATFMTTARENGASLQQVHRAAGYRDPCTTKLYDRRSYNPEESAGFFASY